MKKLFYCLVVAAFVGCGSKSDGNGKNFGQAIANYLNKGDDLCVPFEAMPYSLLDDEYSTFLRNYLGAFVSAGLIQVASVPVHRKDLAGRPTQKIGNGQKWELTPLGAKYYHDVQVDRHTMDGLVKERQGRLCYGRKVLEKIVKWDEPMDFAGAKITNVSFVYGIKDAPDWAKLPEIKKVAPPLAKDIDGSGKTIATATLKLTNLGWEAIGSD